MYGREIFRFNYRTFSCKRFKFIGRYEIFKQVTRQLLTTFLNKSVSGGKICIFTESNRIFFIMNEKNLYQE